MYFESEKLGFSRDDVYAALKENDIFSRKYFYPAINDLDCYKGLEGSTPVAHEVSLNILCLPIYEGLTKEEIDIVCDVIIRKLHL